MVESIHVYFVWKKPQFAMENLLQDVVALPSPEPFWQGWTC